MMRRILCGILAVGMMLLSVGCSMDMVQILDHPQQVAPSSHFEVSLVNQYMLMLNGATATSDVNRDSIHLAVGLPDGYSVIAAKYYFANNLSVMKLASKMDSAAAEQALKDSSSAYKSRASIMQSTPQFIDVLKHRSYTADNANNQDSITVNTDAVKTWSAWSGKVNITIPTGTPVDTIVDTSMSGMSISLGVISKSVFVWLTLQAKSSVGLDTLLYFTKTASMPALSDTSNADIGQFTYVPLTVTGAGVKLSNRSKTDHSVLSIFSYPGGDNVFINFRSIYKDAIAAEVFNVSGKKVADLSSAIPGSNGSIVWHFKNNAVQPGLYILRVKARNDSYSSSLRVF